MSDTELSCRELIDILAAYLDDELDAEQRALFDAHLGDCPECMEYLRGYRRTMDLARDTAAADPVPGDIPERLVAAVMAVLPSRRRLTP
ncbi:MAG TPA: zf-HC2 domain-containing protein [Candidatus Limnocylindrales bacterium]|nr:zf-HC2 domain-containing protein [Candidatus Limnocylindrales bacterium]